MYRWIERSGAAPRVRHRGMALAPRSGMTLFPGVMTSAPYRSRARRELGRISLELEFERERAQALARAAQADPGLALKASAAEVRVAALRARAAQLRRAAGRLEPAA